VSSRSTGLLLSPIGLDPRCWEGLDHPWDDTITYTYPGFGDRAPAEEEYRLEDLADEIRDLIHARGGEAVHVVGISMGGMLAQQLAIRHPGTVASLVLVCTGPDSSPAVLRRRAADMETWERTRVVENTLERWFSPETLAKEPPPRGLVYARKVLEEIDRRSFALGWLALAEHDVTARLHEIRVPTTCIAAEHDTAAPVARVRRIADGVPLSRLIVVPGAHLTFLEHPDRFGAELAAHADWVGNG
jgi:3-oxoadipate enol-lactonase